MDCNQCLVAQYLRGSIAPTESQTMATNGTNNPVNPTQRPPTAPVNLQQIGHGIEAAIQTGVTDVRENLSFMALREQTLGMLCQTSTRTNRNLLLLTWRQPTSTSSLPCASMETPRDGLRHQSLSTTMMAKTALLQCEHPMMRPWRKPAWKPFFLDQSVRPSTRL